MARTPVLTSTTLSPFGGGGGGFGAFNIINPGQTAYLEFLKTKVAWENGEVTNADYLAAYEVYVGKLKGSTQVNARQSLDETRYRLERNDLMAAIERGEQEWADLLDYDRSHLEGLNTESQVYLDRLDLYQGTQARILQEGAQEQHALYEAGRLTTAQLRDWYLAQVAELDLDLNPDLAEQISDQVTSLDLRLVGEADQNMISLYRDGKIGNDAFLAYAETARARYAVGTEDQKRWTDLIDDASAAIAETSLAYRYGLSQDYIQLQKFIADQKEMLRRAGSSSTSTSQRIVLGADGQWKVVTSTKSSPYKPSAAEIKAMKERRLELASAERQLAEWTTKIVSAGGFVTTDQMITFYSGRQAKVVKGTDEWYQLQTRIDGLEQQRYQERVLAKEGVRITFGAGPGPKVGTSGTGNKATKAGGGTGTTTYAGGGGTKPAGGGGGTKPAAGGPLQIVTGVQPVRRVGPVLVTRSAKFPTNLDGSAFLKFYSGFIAAYEDGATTFTDYSSGKPVTYYLPEDPGELVTMVGELDRMRIDYYATRAKVYRGTPSEITAAKEYSDAIKDSAENAYTILLVEGRRETSASPIVNPIAEGQRVVDAAQQYYNDQVEAAQAAWDRGDFSAAWSHLQLATRRAAETETRVQGYVGLARKQMRAIYQQTGEAAPDAVEGALNELAAWGETSGWAKSKSNADKLSNEIATRVKGTGSGETFKPTWVVSGPGGPKLQLRDDTAIFVNRDGKIRYDVVPSGGYVKPNSQDQVPDLPGYVRVQLNLNGTVPNAPVYAQWSVGTVGFGPNETPIQGKIIRLGFEDGQIVTLGENPFSPGKWSLANQTFKVPDNFKAVGEGDVFQFTRDGTNYLLVFDAKAGRYNVVRPGDPFGREEEVIPITEADAQALLAGAGFGLDLSVVLSGDRWQFDMSAPYAGFSKEEYFRFTTPGALIPGVSAEQRSELDRISAVWRAYQPQLPDAADIAGAGAARRAWSDRQVGIRPPAPIVGGDTEMLAARRLWSLRKIQEPLPTVPPTPDRGWYDEQQQAQIDLPTAERAAADRAVELPLLEKASLNQLKLANIQTAAATPSPTPTKSTTTTATRKKRRTTSRATTTTTTAKTLSALPKIQTSKAAQLEKALF